MSLKSALPGLAAGLLGLTAGLLSIGINSPMFGVVAGVLALAAGVAGLRTSQQMAEQSAVKGLVEEELRNVRAEARQTAVKLQEEISSSPVETDEEFENSDPLFDDITGLFSESFFQVVLDSRIAAARRHLRPVAIVLLDIVQNLQQTNQSPANPEIITEAINETLREADTACRLRNGDFALVLEDTPENGAIWTVERIRRHLMAMGANLTVWAGVACYPAHAFGPDEIMNAADAALEAAREWHQDRIEVAVAVSD